MNKSSPRGDTEVNGNLSVLRNGNSGQVLHEQPLVGPAARCYPGWNQIAGHCVYHQQKGLQPCNLMVEGRVRYKPYMPTLLARFDHIHVHERGGAVGSLSDECDAHKLAIAMRHYLAKEVLGHFGNPKFEFETHHWSKPHPKLFN